MPTVQIVKWLSIREAKSTSRVRVRGASIAFTFAQILLGGKSRIPAFSFQAMINQGKLVYLALGGNQSMKKETLNFKQGRVDAN